MALSESETGASTPDRRQRIAKLMARAGLCSRRDAEAWIVAGRVSVNGTVLSSPAVDVAAEDAILVDGAPLPALEKTRLFLFHKPRGLVTSDHDPEGRATVTDFLRTNWPQGPRVVTIGRLDINTEGLLLLTNDGGLARTLELPQTGWLRRYRVRAKGTVDPAALDALAEGITVDGITYAGIEAKLDRTQGANVWLTMGLREGKNREVKKVLEHLGLEVNRLIRLSFGPFQLAELPEGAVEEVRTRVLRDQLGAKLAAQAGVDFDATGSDRPQAADERIAQETRKAERRSDAKPDRDQRPQEHRKPQARARQSETRPDRASRTRPGRPEQGSRSTETRPGDRHERRRPSTDEARPPKRERPTGGPRKHVTTLRKEAGAPGGPRTRIERSDTRDRRDRTIAVERLVPPRGPGPETRPPRERTERRASSPTKNAGPRRRDPEDRTRRSADERPSNRPGADGERRPDRRDAGAGKPRRFGSPSAEGKRERIARSGPRREEVAGRGGKGERPSTTGRTRSQGKPPRRDGSAEARPERARFVSGKPSPSRPGQSGETPRSAPRKGPSRGQGAGRPTGPRKGAAGRPRGPSKPKR